MSRILHHTGRRTSKAEVFFNSNTVPGSTVVNVNGCI